MDVLHEVKGSARRRVHQVCREVEHTKASTKHGQTTSILFSNVIVSGAPVPAFAWLHNSSGTQSQKYGLVYSKKNMIHMISR